MSNNLLPQVNPTPPDKLRIDFIGMAFALAIGEIGLEIGKLLEAGIRFRDHLYLLTHIILSVYIIASSWIGWNLSESKGNKEKVRDPFSISFVILLIDLYLVICYFIIVQCIGRDPLNPDSKNQINWSIMIFATYMVWDFFSKVIVEEDITLNMRFINSKNELREYLNRFYQAPICLIFIFVFIRPMRFDTRPNAVVCADLLLIGVFILFRGMKSFKNNPHKVPLYIIAPLMFITFIYGIYKLFL